MDITSPSALLNGLSPQEFMRKHWQKKPLLVRAAVTAGEYALSTQELFAIAARDDVHSRLITRKQAWTVLVQGMNLQHTAMARLMQRFRFVPDARLDDVMVSYATPGGGVGAHVDSYDVFLLQLQGTRRWSIGPLKTARDRALVEGAPLKLLKHFKPTQQFDLAPGDMLYLPPGYGHDGVAVDACLTASIGFRAPRAGELAAELLEQLAEVVRAAEVGKYSQLYVDVSQAATTRASQIPTSLSEFLESTWKSIQPSKADFEQVVGSYLSEPKPHVWFAQAAPAKGKSPFKSAMVGSVTLAPATQMLYGKRALYVNGEVLMWNEFSAQERAWLKQLTDQRGADVQQLKGISAEIEDLLDEWLAAGYLVIMNGMTMTTKAKG
jgi:50S ribosomal protein L16 3-hydroxylase